MSGTTLCLPEGYRGHVISKASADEPAASGPSAWRVETGFNSLTYWKHGADPVSADGPQKRMQFLRISQEVWQHPLAILHVQQDDAATSVHHWSWMLMLTAYGVAGQMHAPVSEEEITGELEKPSFAGAAGAN